MIARDDVHVYIDTSFLMWATKIGPASRGELLEWLRTDLGERAHIPTWSAHEYLRHHVAGTIVDELKERSSAVAQVVGTTFSYFRPFLDDPALPAAEGFDRLRASTREAINTLERLVKATKQWKQAYPAHAAEIITFINERVMDVGNLYERMPSIAIEGAARYEGRIPPGFQDRNKKGAAADDDPDDLTAAGANRYGDLIFWKEALTHAAGANAGAIIVLTNDRKNDWRMGGEASATIDQGMLSLRKSWRPVPRIHPMLALEGKLAGIDEVALIDSQYLAAFLRSVDETRLGAFADVAIVPDPPTQADRRAEAIEQRHTEVAAAAEAAIAAAAAQAVEDGQRFPDDPAVRSTRTTFGRALLASRDGADERGAALLQRVRADVGPSERFEEVLTRDALAGMDHIALAKVARGLHDAVLAGEPGYEEALADLAGLLEELPSATAGALILGLLASMYLEPASGNSRIPPRSPVDRLLLHSIERPWAETAANVITARLAGNERQPLTGPVPETVTAAFETETETMETDELRSLKIAGVEALTAAQAEPGLRLRDLCEARSCTGGTVLEHAAQLFSIPLERLDAGGDETTEYFLTETIGFRPPNAVHRNKEEA